MERELFNELKEGIDALSQLRKEQQEVKNPHDGSTLDSFLLEEAENKIKQWEECADNLVDYAREFVENLSTWGKGYNRYDREIKQAEDAIKEYLKLKNEI